MLGRTGNGSETVSGNSSADDQTFRFHVTGTIIWQNGRGPRERVQVNRSVWADSVDEAFALVKAPYATARTLVADLEAWRKGER